VRQGVLDKGNLKTARLEVVDRQADAIQCNRPVKHEQRLERAGDRDVHQLRIPVPTDGGDDAHAVDVSLDDVTAQSVVGSQGALEVDAGALLPVADRRALESRGDGRRLEPSFAEFPDGEAGAVYGNALSISRSSNEARGSSRPASSAARSTSLTRRSIR
jgi:hypothetical protein